MKMDQNSEKLAEFRRRFDLIVKARVNYSFSGFTRIMDNIQSKSKNSDVSVRFVASVLIFGTFLRFCVRKARLSWNQCPILSKIV